MKYCLDSNFFIHAWRCYYSPEISTDFWDWLASLAVQNIIFVPQEVFEEIEIGKDGLFNWMKAIEHDIVCHLDDAVQNEISQIITLPEAVRLADSNKKHAADVFIVAYAKRYNATVVSNDNCIRELCKSCAVRWLRDDEFLKEQRLKMSVIK